MSAGRGPRLVALLLACLLVAACGPRDEDGEGAAGASASGGGEAGAGATAPGGAAPSGEEDAGPPRPVETWPARRPAISLLVVGAQRGRLRPSPATVPALGGLERLAALAEALRHRVRDPGGFAGISAGWTLDDHPEPQDESKATLYRAVLELLGFRALLLGTPDLLEPALLQPREGAGGVDVPRPPANVPPGSDGLAAMLAWVEPFADFEVAGLPVRAFSVVDPDEGAVLVQSGVSEVVLPPAGALQTISPRPDTLWIATTRADRETLLGLREAMARLGPAILIDLGGTAGRARLEDHRLGDVPVVLSLGEDGREVGVLDLDPVAEAEGGGWRLSWHVVELVPSLAEKESALREQVARLVDRYREEVRERGYLAAFPSLPDREGLRYVGSSRCATCHPGIYESWSTTAHAGALRTLQTSGDEADPACVRCHVVGFERFGDGTWRRLASGFTSAARTPYLGGVGCESCHGPGSAHIDRPHDATIWEAGRPNRSRPSRRDCMVCHDAENSPGFGTGHATEYLPAVDHRRVPGDRRTVPGR